MEDNISLQKSKKGAVKNEDELAPLLRSRKALKLFHEKCLDWIREKNVTYLTPDDLSVLLGESSNANPAFVKDLMNIMVANVCRTRISILIIRILFNISRRREGNLRLNL